MTFYKFTSLQVSPYPPLQACDIILFYIIQLPMLVILSIVHLIIEILAILAIAKR